MDHVLMLDSKACEPESLYDGTRSMIIRGSDEMMSCYSNIKEGDRLYLSRDNADGEIIASGIVSKILISGRLTLEESYEVIIHNQDKLQLPDDQFYRWAGKPYLVLIGLASVKSIGLDLIEADQHLSFLIPKTKA
jgi:hypothetical protein